MLVSFSCGSLALWVAALIQKKGEQNLTTILMFVTGVSLGQGLICDSPLNSNLGLISSFRLGGYLRNYSQYSLAVRLVQASLLLSLLVVCYSFTGIVTSLITSPRYKFIVRSIEDVVANQQIQPLIIMESSTHAEFEVWKFAVPAVFILPHLYIVSFVSTSMFIRLNRIPLTQLSKKFLSV